ncbi:MAG: hypothetical protein A2Y12_18930 [Planctomycetes bacterium GWF2_42_9]|nr:MAG: hypothetical protein A2Y12_18930 [Planctomycetes bacterium GWF2_42_9]
MKKIIGKCIISIFFKNTYKKSHLICNIKPSTFLVSLFTLFFVISTARGQIFTNVFFRDSNTPLQLTSSSSPYYTYEEIMVGTHLKIVVSSDAAERWFSGVDGDGGSLTIEGNYLNFGALSARGPLLGEDWSGSHLPDAGSEPDYPDVILWEMDGIYGFDLYTDSRNVNAGDWFVIDYNAIAVGDCIVNFYDHRVSWDFPIYYLCFSHVPTRDFNNDKIVNFHDFYLFLNHWLETNCLDPYWCEGTDLDRNNLVDIQDLFAFCEFWLERTE